MFLFVICSASVVEEIFEYLDAPIERITGADVPLPYATNLERMALPQVSSLHIYFSAYIVVVSGPLNMTHVFNS